MIQKYGRRLIVYQTIEIPVEPWIGSGHSASNPVAVSRYYEKQWEMFNRNRAGDDATEMNEAFVPEPEPEIPEEDTMYTRRRRRNKRN